MKPISREKSLVEEETVKSSKTVSCKVCKKWYDPAERFEHYREHLKEMTVPREDLLDYSTGTPLMAEDLAQMVGENIKVKDEPLETITTLCPRCKAKKWYKGMRFSEVPIVCFSCGSDLNIHRSPWEDSVCNIIPDKDDNVNHPTHYTSGGIEVWDFLIDQGLSYFEGNIVKYICRWKIKNGLEDLRKAKAYLDKLIKWEEGNGE